MRAKDWTEDSDKYLAEAIKECTTGDGIMYVIPQTIQWEVFNLFCDNNFIWSPIYLYLTRWSRVAAMMQSKGYHFTDNQVYCPIFKDGLAIWASSYLFSFWN